MKLPNKTLDLSLLESSKQFLLSLASDEIPSGFLSEFSFCGDNWRGVEPHHLPASDRLELMVPHTSPTTYGIVAQFATGRNSLHWEQAYTSADSQVTDHMLDNYGYAELVGKNGPFLSDRVRAGVAIYGPGIHYPLHNHAAAEIYVVLAGSAIFRLENISPKKRVPGEVIYHPPNAGHGLDTGQDTLVIFYLWHGGDMREKPSFIET